MCLARSRGGSRGTVPVSSAPPVPQELQALTGDQIGVCESIESLHGHVGHIVSNSALPVKPLPDFSVEYLFL